MSDKLKPIFCRVGNKAKLIKKILPFIPQHKVYIEPFVGSAAVYFGVTNPGEKRIINDLDKSLIDAYKVLKKGISISEDYLAGNLEEQQKIYDKPIKTEKDKFIHELLNCITFSSQGKGKLYKTGRTFVTKLSKLNEYKQFMKNTTILNQDYKKVIDKYDSADSFFFLDPPYENSDNLYKHSQFNFEELRDKLLNIKGLFLLTLNDSPNIRKIFKDFIIKPILVKATGPTAIGSKDRKELFIMNYEI